MGVKMFKFISLWMLCLGVLFSCGKKDAPSLDGDPHQKEIQESMGFFEIKKSLIQAKSSSEYKTLLKCALDKEGRSCTPAKVPLLSMKNREFTPDFILENTLVSHQFLADTFKEFLNSLEDQTLLKMFNAVSGIIISDQLASSFYYGLNGMIYLNANYFWKTQEEKAKLKYQRRDGRFEFDKRAKIGNSLDYVKENQRINPLKWKEERTLSDLSPNLKRLLYHELSHANDYFPATMHDSIDTQKFYGELRKERLDNKEIVSQRIEVPSSFGTYEYAEFYVYGYLVNPDSYVFTREDFLNEFVSDNGMVFYSYVTTREHLAMIMQSYFMLFIEGYESCNSAFEDDREANKFEYFWFQKNRVLQPNILATAKDILEKMLEPELAQQLSNMSTAHTVESVNEAFYNIADHCKSN